MQRSGKSRQNREPNSLNFLFLVIIFLLLTMVMVITEGVNGRELITQVMAFGIIFTIILVVILFARNRTPQQPPPQMQVDLGIEKDFVIRPTTSNVTFNDVAGISEVKEELMEIVDFLKNPKKYRDFGIRLPKGVLLVGPPGVGKTLIAKAVAGEAGVPFFYQSGSSFVQMYVGVGAKRVRDLFNKAKMMAPSIVFIDEIDAIGKARGNMRNDEREATLNQLLTEMDGFEDSSGVIVIGATNKIELLDDALLRPGRFDRRIYVGLPGLKDRLEILKVHMKNKPFKGNLETIAQMTVGFSGAALASLVNEASIHALKRGKHYIDESDFFAVKDKVLVGKKKLQTYSPQEKEILSYYQATKAVVAEWLGVDFERITLVKDDFKEEDKEIVSRSELMNKIAVYLSGRVGVEEKFKEKFSNAHLDLRKARELAIKMVQDYGMGNRLVAAEGEIGEILEEAYQQVRDIYRTNQELIERAYQLIQSREVLHLEDIKQLREEVL
ncbi:MAG: AAA family ATPase [Campylobacterales bacterium]